MELYCCCTPKQLERESLKQFKRENKELMKKVKEKDPKKIAINCYNDYLDKNPFLYTYFNRA